MRATRDLESRVHVLKDFVTGRDVFILTCGPSLATLDADRLRERLRNEVVICVKQTFEDFGDIADFHLINAYNHQRYDYARNPSAVVIAGLKPSDPPIFGPTPDITLPLEPPVPGRRMAVRRNFPEYELGRTVVRPWGPGIMYELGIFLAVHIGARNLYVAGWDLDAPGSTRLSHYYDRDARATPTLAQRLAASARGAPLGVGRAVAWTTNLVHHLGGRRYNRAPAPPDEVEVVAASTGALHDWLRGRGVSLHLLTPNATFDARIPRITLADLPRVESD